MANKVHPVEIVHNERRYELVSQQRAPKSIIHKGARYVLALEKDPPDEGSPLKDIPSEPKPKPGTRAPKFGPPPTLPGGRLDPSLIPELEKVEERALQKMKQLEEGPEDERREHVRKFTTDVSDPAVRDSAAYVYHEWPTTKALLDKVNYSGLMGVLHNEGRNLTIKLSDIMSPSFPFREALQNPEEYPAEVEQINVALHTFMVDTANLVGAVEVLLELYRSLAGQLIERGLFKPREFKELKAKYKKELEAITKYDAAMRRSIQKPASGTPARGTRGRNPQYT